MVSHVIFFFKYKTIDHADDPDILSRKNYMFSHCYKPKTPSPNVSSVTTD